MANDTKQVRKVARCLSTLLETEGVEIQSKDVMSIIMDEDLSDINLLKGKVLNDMREKKTATEVKPGRRQKLEAFIISNWGIINGNDVVKDALINAYTQGRISKEDREVMKSNLMGKINGEVSQETAEVIENVTEEIVSGMTSEEVEEHKEYDF